MCKEGLGSERHHITDPGAYRFAGSSSDSSSSNDAPSNTPPDDGTDSSPNTPPSIASNDTSSGDGIGSVEGANGGIGINAGDTDGDGLINQSVGPEFPADPRIDPDRIERCLMG
jgi:hypothetical protein